MPSLNAPLLAFNRGEISKYGLARVDLEKNRLAAQEQKNWQPWVLGPMMLRPGLQYVGGVNDHLQARNIPFIFSNDDMALLELTDEVLRVWLVADDVETLVTRPSVSTVVTNGDFSFSTGWTLTATGSGASATISGGKLNLASPAAGGLARGKRSVTVAAGDQNVEHAFRIIVDRGPIRFRAGSTDGDDDYISETTLDTGTHSLAFTPTGGTVYIQLETITAQTKIVDSITIEAAGALELPTPWTDDDLGYIRTDQSGDIVFMACYGFQQRKIERRAEKSWSVVLYKSDDGPFQADNATDITLTPSALAGNGTLTASRALFRAGHVGCLFRLFSTGQTTNNTLSAGNTFGDTIRVSGVGEDRRFQFDISGTWSGTLTFQRSLESATSGFVDYNVATVNQSSTYADGLDNVIAWYRVGFKTGNYTSGNATIALTYPGGGNSGVARVTSISSTTVANVEILSIFSSLSATTDWAEGDWSELSGWPSAVAFHDGRLFWAGRDRVWGSVSDNYYSFDPAVEGDSGPINRSVGFGPVDVINWLLPLSRLIAGRQGAETSIRSSSFDEPLTPTNFSPKDCSTQGSAPISPAKIDKRGVFVQQSNQRVYELGFSLDDQDYRGRDLTRLNADVGDEGFVDLDVARQPDTQLHFVRSDGEVAALLLDRDDEVEAWWRIETPGASGLIEDVCILPGTKENRVYYIVKRTIGGQTKRFIEKLARRDQCYGLPEGRLADSHVMYSGAATTTITGLSHLEGQSVVVWGWNTSSPFTATKPDGTSVTVGRDLGTFTVSSGQITGLAAQVTRACVGLTYDATFRSAKLAYAAAQGTALAQKKKIDRVGLVVANTHCSGLRYGQSFEETEMDTLPMVEQGATLDTNLVWDELDSGMTTVPGEWDTDSRLCLKASAPKPAMVLAAVVDITTHE